MSIFNEAIKIIESKDKPQYQLLQEAFWVQLFNDTQHGDKEHREWLRDKYIESEYKKSGLKLNKDLFTIKT
jgi:hypothetical protein